jgi:hypothetical protein
MGEPKEIIVLNGYWICPACHMTNPDKFEPSLSATMTCERCKQLVVREVSHVAAQEIDRSASSRGLVLLLFGVVIISLVIYFLLRK